MMQFILQESHSTTGGERAAVAQEWMEMKPGGFTVVKLWDGSGYNQGDYPISV